MWQIFKTWFVQGYEEHRERNRYILHMTRTARRIMLGCAAYIRVIVVSAKDRPDNWESIP